MNDDMKASTGTSPFFLSTFFLSAIPNAAMTMVNFGCHGQKLVNHTDIEALLWANIGRHEVVLRCLTPEN